MSLPPLHAPREHGSMLAEPPLDQVGALLERNRALIHAAPVEILQQPLASVRALARDEARHAAAAYFEESGEPMPPRIEEPRYWMLAGHQPELFHPGVWVKNFAMHKLARRHGAFALNLVVDNDLARASVLRLPAGERTAKVAFDHGQGEVPYEERSVASEELFASLPERTRPLIQHWPFTPLLAKFWAEMERQASRTRLLGERCAAARRSFERHWGCHQHEVPLSRLCRSEAFALFAGHLLEHLPRLHDCYNGAVHDYRRRHGLRSVNHPVPDLARHDDWLEAPFWAWRPGQARRARLFIRRGPDRLDLRADTAAWPSLPCPTAGTFVRAWRDLERDGYKVRTRALTTTLFARLCLADLFLHGIGGGKYDELTDVLLERFFGVAPAPAYLVLSATLLLPLPRHAARAEECRQLAREARDVWYNPQRHLNDKPATVADLVRQKQHWIERAAPTHAERLQRFQALRRLNDELRPFLNGAEERLRQAARTCRAQVHANQIATRRDYAFCLYPEEMLRSYFQHLSSA